MYTHTHTHTHKHKRIYCVHVQSYIFALIYMLFFSEGQTGEACETSTKQRSCRNREHCIEKHFHLMFNGSQSYKSLNIALISFLNFFFQSAVLFRHVKIGFIRAGIIQPSAFKVYCKRLAHFSEVLAGKQTMNCTPLSRLSN